MPITSNDGSAHLAPEADDTDDSNGGDDDPGAGGGDGAGGADGGSLGTARDKCIEYKCTVPSKDSRAPGCRLAKKELAGDGTDGSDGAGGAEASAALRA